MEDEIISEEYKMSCDERIQFLEQEIRNLTSQLTSSVSSVGDWKVVKCYEASLVGLESPYDINALHAERQAIRDRINEIQQRIEEIENVEETEMEDTDVSE